MGTRSDIIVQRRDGKFARIYCHFDGYLEGVGKTLFEHYNDAKKAEALTKLGDLSSLGEEIGEKHDFEYREKFYQKYKPPGQQFGTDHDARDADPEYQRLKRMCLAYGRDRGEKGCRAKLAATLAECWPPEDTWTEFTYVFARDGQHPKGRWMVGDPDEGTQTLIDLGDALSGKRTLCPNVKAFGMVIGQHLPHKPGRDHSWTS